MSNGVYEVYVCKYDGVVVYVGQGKYKTAGLLKMSSAISNIKNGQTSSKSAHVIFIDLLIECYQKHYDVEGIVHFV